MPISSGTATPMGNNVFEVFITTRVKCGFHVMKMLCSQIQGHQLNTYAKNLCCHSFANSSE
jgi:hypothetical protein